MTHTKSLLEDYQKPKETISLGTPRQWFPKEYPRIVGFIPSYFINQALFSIRGMKPEVFKFDGVVSVSTEKAKKLEDIENKEKDVSIKVILGHRPSVHVQHPLTNVLSIETQAKPLNEILEDALDLTGKPELFPELVIHDVGWKFKLPKQLENEIQGIETLYQYVRSRGYHIKPMDKLLGIRFFDPFRTMETYLRANSEIINAVRQQMKKLGVEGNPLDRRRWRSVHETKWFTSDLKGFDEFSEKLFLLQKELTKDKFEQDVAIYHEIANQTLMDHGIQIGGHIYELLRIAELDLYSPFIPLWHEEIPRNLLIK